MHNSQLEREIRTLEGVSRALHLQAGFHTFQDLWQLTVTRPTTFSSAEKGLPEVRGKNQKPRRWVAREERTAEKWQLHCQVQISPHPSHPSRRISRHDRRQRLDLLEQCRNEDWPMNIWTPCSRQRVAPGCSNQSHRLQCLQHRLNRLNICPIVKPWAYR